MANSLSKQIVEEGPRNAIVKLAGVLDSSNVILTPAVSLSDFTNNDVRQNFVGLRIDFIDYSSGPQLVTSLEWNSANPQLIAGFAQSDELDFKTSGGIIPDMTRSAYDGAINLRTVGFVPGNYATYTIVLKMVKLYKA